MTSIHFHTVMRHGRAAALLAGVIALGLAVPATADPAPAPPPPPPPIPFWLCPECHAPKIFLFPEAHPDIFGLLPPELRTELLEPSIPAPAPVPPASDPWPLVR